MRAVNAPSAVETLAPPPREPLLLLLFWCACKEASAPSSSSMDRGRGSESKESREANPPGGWRGSPDVDSGPACAVCDRGLWGEPAPDRCLSGWLDSWSVCEFWRGTCRKGGTSAALPVFFRLLECFLVSFGFSSLGLVSLFGGSLGSEGEGGLKLSASFRIALRRSCMLLAGKGNRPSTILYKIHPILHISLDRRSKSVCGA